MLVTAFLSRKQKKRPETVRRIYGRSEGERLAFFARVLNAQVVGDLAETQTSLSRADSRDILFHVIVDHAFECHVAVIHDDVDGRYSLDGVARQNGIAVDSARDLQPETIIEK